MTSITFSFCSAAPDGNGYQRVTTDGPVDATTSVAGSYAKASFPRKHLVFDQTSSSGEPVPLCPVGIGAFNVKNSYGYVNYNVQFMVLHYDGDFVQVSMSVTPEVSDMNVNAKRSLQMASKRW